jgi:hypothetical protein
MMNGQLPIHHSIKNNNRKKIQQIEKHFKIRNDEKNFVSSVCSSVNDIDSATADQYQTFLLRPGGKQPRIHGCQQ